MDEEDYRELGLRVGLEIHRQLKGRKLFCSCPAELNDEEHPFEISRRLNLAESEMGEVDRAAEEEVRRGKTFRYQVPKGVCLVEMDEEPPRGPNPEAVKGALVIAHMLNMKVVDELIYMRKIVVDGSNTTGFQRTALLGVDGFVELKGGRRVGIESLCLEEDAARIVERGEGEVVYRLDRLGIPEVEISTAPEARTPEEARELARRIGEILRRSGVVRRGIGTIRQDVNISIKGGARCEIKLVQELSLIPKVVRWEVGRQLRLLKARDVLLERGVRVEDLKGEVEELTHIFRETQSKIVRRVIKRGGGVFGVALPGFSGLLGSLPGDDERCLGPELAAYARARGVGGIFHSDELPSYGIGEEEVERVREALSLGKLDAFVLVVEVEEKAREALKAVLQRARMALNGVPEEVRRALPDGKTEYMRPLPGAARMYPETDIPPYRIDEDKVRSAREALPEPIEVAVKRLVERYELPQQEAEVLVREGLDGLYQRYASSHSRQAVNTLFLRGRAAAGEVGVSFSDLPEEVLEVVLKAVDEGRIAKEAVEEVIRRSLEKPSEENELLQRVREAIGELGVGEEVEADARLFIERLVKERADLIKERGERAFSPLMGVVMREFRGRVDGGKLASWLKEEIERSLKGG